jgi:hypothetical protein
LLLSSCGKPEAGIGHLVAEIAELHYAIQRAIVDGAGCAAGGFEREVRHPAGGVLSRSVERNRLADNILAFNSDTGNFYQ